MIAKSYAKLNLLLDVVEKLPTHYHSLRMLMQSVDLFDLVTVEKTEELGVKLTCNVPGVPTDYRNICHKAVVLFQAETELSFGVRIHLEKKIPFGAGLGGGSTNAAAVLWMLRELFCPNISEKSLHTVASQVGADVPFCMEGGLCQAEGIGDFLVPLPDLLKTHEFYITKPDFFVNTAQAYRNLDRIKFLRPQTEEALKMAKSGNVEEFLSLCENVFEQAVNIPGLKNAKKEIKQLGSPLCMMTGSGSAVFAVIPEGFDLEKSVKIENSLRRIGRFLGKFRTTERGAEIISVT